MSKKGIASTKSSHLLDIDISDCPFREFRDNELHFEFWGLVSERLIRVLLAFRAAQLSKSSGKLPDHAWVDEQIQPLPRSVRHDIHGWVRAEDLALSKWEAETVIFEDNDGGKMSIVDFQRSHAQVLMRSSFSRNVMSICYLLENVDTFLVEHQWENFSAASPLKDGEQVSHLLTWNEAWRGLQHRPGLSKNGCYLIRLFHLGAWRCVWVNDQVPVM
ncbi:hypothetical protein ACJJTC_016132 [Scirpophaga incertulas]